MCVGVGGGGGGGGGFCFVNTPLPHHGERKGTPLSGWRSKGSGCRAGGRNREGEDWLFVQANLVSDQRLHDWIITLEVMVTGSEVRDKGLIYTLPPWRRWVYLQQVGVAPWRGSAGGKHRRGLAIICIYVDMHFIHHGAS